MARLRLKDILALAPEPPEPERRFLIRITPQALAMLMATRWIPEDQPQHRVKVVGVNEHEDGFSDLLIVSESP